MATRRIVPRADLEGSLGSGEKRWEKAYVGNVGNVYDTVADMVADLELREGSTVETNGQNSLNDGLAAKYIIREMLVSDVEDGDVIIFLDNGNVAEKVVTEADTNIAEIDIDIEAIHTELDGEVTKTLYGCTNYVQDSALYDNKLFTFGGNKQMKVYDWITKELIGTFTVGGDITTHFNSATWGHKQNESDPYPLLYSSGYTGLEADGTTPLPEGTCQVYKINADYSSSLVQDIRIGFLTDELWAFNTTMGSGAIGYGDFIADPDNNKLYVIKSSIFNDVPFTRVFVFALPDTSSANVTLAKTDVLDYYDLPFYSTIQGAAYHDNKIYLTYGDVNNADGDRGLVVIDVSAKTQVSIVSLADLFNEPEAVVIDNDEMYVASKGTGFYKLSHIPLTSNIGSMSDLSGTGVNRLSKAVGTAHYNASLIVDGAYVRSVTVYLDVPNDTNITTLWNKIIDKIRKKTKVDDAFCFFNAWVFYNPGFICYIGIMNIGTKRGRMMTMPYAGNAVTSPPDIYSFADGALTGHVTVNVTQV